MKVLNYLYIPILIVQLSFSQDRDGVCGTPPMSSEQVLQIKSDMESWSSTRSRNEAIHIMVAWHVVTNSSGAGNYSDQSIYDIMEILNSNYQEHNFFFTLDTIDRTENSTWFNSWEDANASQGMQELAIDPYHYLNIYTADLNAIGVEGYSYLPNSWANNSYMQSVNLDYRSLSAGWIITHEVGHHLGLPHTFQNNCTEPNDGIDDTPQHDESGLWSCNQNQDTCPNDPGNDPVYNYMNYSGTCQNEYTQGQEDRQHYMTENYHPGYLENDFNFPLLKVSAASFLQDTDGDNRFNPGDTSRVKIVLANDWGGDAVNIALTLESNDPRINILDNYIQFNDSPLGDITIPAQEIGSTPFDWFLVTADAGAIPGTIPCTVTITAGTEEYPYQEVVDLNLDLTLSQFGFPLAGIVVKSSPVVADLNNDGLKEIYFGSDNEALHGYNSFGEELDGFPFESTDRVRSSPAIGDVDNDGEMEIVFGNSSGKLYIIDSDGSRQLAYTILGFIEGSPALVDIDGDQDLEIAFTTTTSSGGQLYVIHHNGITVSGFPKELGSMWAGPAVHDIDNDGLFDVVVTTYDKEVYAIEANGGTVKSGFPFVTEGRFSTAPIIVDVDNDGDYEIVVGNNSGALYVLHYDGTIFAEYDTGDDIRGGISVCDLNNDGQLDLLFGGYDDRVHVWDPVANELLDGWPVDLGFNILSEPLVADLDGDGQVEVLAARKTGKIFAYESDGSMMPNFPIAINGSIESTPVIEDIDGDGDLEIVVGSSSGLDVIDIKSSTELMDNWSVYRGTINRAGVYDASVMAIEGNKYILPKRFYVSSNYPNPFNPTTNFYIDIPASGKLAVKVFDVNGRMVKELINTQVNAGRVQGQWSGKNQFDMLSPTGIYFLHVETATNYHVQKLALVK